MQSRAHSSTKSGGRKSFLVRLIAALFGLEVVIVPPLLLSEVILIVVLQRAAPPPLRAVLDRQQI
jgi:hypothetical protein